MGISYTTTDTHPSYSRVSCLLEEKSPEKSQSKAVSRRVPFYEVSDAISQRLCDTTEFQSLVARPSAPGASYGTHATESDTITMGYLNKPTHMFTGRKTFVTNLFASKFDSIEPCVSLFKFPKLNELQNTSTMLQTLARATKTERYWLDQKFLWKFEVFEMYSRGAPIGEILPALKNLAYALRRMQSFDDEGLVRLYTWKLMLLTYGRTHRATAAAAYEMAATEYERMAELPSFDTPRSVEFYFKRDLQPLVKDLEKDESLYLSMMQLAARILRMKWSYALSERGTRQLIQIVLTSQEHTKRFLLSLLIDLSNILHDNESYEESEEVKIQVICLQHSGRFHVTFADIVDAHVSLSKTYRAQGNYKKSIQMLRDNLVIWTSVASPNHSDLVPAITELAMSLRSDGRFNEAWETERPMREYLHINYSCQGFHDLDHFLMAGNLKYKLSDYKGALEQYLVVANEHRCGHRVALSYDIAYVYHAVGWAYYMMEDHELAPKWFKKSSEALEKRSVGKGVMLYPKEDRSWEGVFG